MAGSLAAMAPFAASSSMEWITDPSLAAGAAGRSRELPAADQTSRSAHCRNAWYRLGEMRSNGTILSGVLVRCPGSMRSRSQLLVEVALAPQEIESIHKLRVGCVRHGFGEAVGGRMGI